MVALFWITPLRSASKQSWWRDAPRRSIPTKPMARPVPEVLPANVLDHPAVKAWSQLQLEGDEPESIESVKQKNKSTVYRLAGLAPDGSAVIAKKCRARTAWVERLIYQEILSELPVPALRCYGCVGDP